MIDLKLLKEKFDEALNKETKESLTEFINNQRKMREEGYYFVKIFDTWVIGWYFPEDNDWNLIGDYNYKDSDFDEIGDKIELPKHKCYEQRWW